MCSLHLGNKMQITFKRLNGKRSRYVVISYYSLHFELITKNFRAFFLVLFNKI